MISNLLRVLLFSLLLTAAAQATAAMPPAENILPADTFVFFTIPDFNALRAAGKVSPQLRFWNDPAMKPFRDKFMGKLTDQYLAPLEKNLGVSLSDFAGLPHGQLTLGVTINGSNGHDDVPPGIVFLLDAKDQGDSLRTNLAALTKKWSADGRDLRTEKIRGADFTVVTLTTNDLASMLPQRPPVSQIGVQPKPAKPVDIYFTQFKSLLVAGNSEGALAAVMAHLTGADLPALADDPIFAADKLEQFRDSPTYYAWFNAHKFLDLISQNSGDGDDGSSGALAPAFSVTKILGAIGLSGLKSASIALRESRDGSLMTVHLNAPAGDRTGLLSILALPPKDANPPDFVPADAVKFSRIRLDGKQTWAELQKIVASFSPNGLAYMNSIIDLANTAAQQKDPGFDLRNYLFGNLGDDVVSYQKAPVGDSPAEFSNPPSLALVAVNNPDQVIRSITVIASMVASQENATPPRDFLGHKIYSIAMRAQRLPDGTALSGPPLLVSASGGYVAFSSDAGILEEYLRSSEGKGRPLSQSPGLADAEAQIGGANGGLFGFQNQRESMRTSFKLLKAQAGSGLETRMLPPAWRDWMDFTLLPDFDQVSKYFYISVYNETTSGDGINFKVFTPRPPQLN
jgi:hypothetical protein